MLTLHHLADSRSQRIVWLLEELELDYQLIRYERDPKTQLAPAKLKQLTPLGTSPVLEVDGDMLMESGAIIDYLLARFDSNKVWQPADALSVAGRDYQFWMHFAEGSMMPMLVLSKVFKTIKQTRMPFFAKPIARKIASSVEQSFIRPAIDKQLAFVETHLGNQDWFAGEQISGADIQMSFPLEAVSTLPGLLNDYPHIAAWLQRIHARPASKQALKKGGEYSFIA